MSIDSLNIDANGYPDEAVLERIRALDDDFLRFMLEDFPVLAEQAACIYGKITSEDVKDVIGRPVRRLTFVTGGWSGCEDFIEAVLCIPIVRLLYYAAWFRGGKHVFEVPLPDSER